ncbi:squalene/phytoene synthase family protein [Streptomyces sp. NPDC093707]|uniref:squalene/phytoene synthase family protein n=1 Tax=Streptomyces sp. NPDC093707 TaxID=3154984 RepID=UPI00344D3EDC
MWGPARLLVPPECQPFGLACAALHVFSDDVCDTGPAAVRRRRFEAWRREVRSALETGDSHHPVVRAYLHASGRRGVSHRWLLSYLDGALADLDFAGFVDEAAYQQYVETLTWPALMLTAGLTPRLVPEDAFASSWRLVADTVQRTDFLMDLRQDLRDGRLYLPLSDLERFEVTPADLAAGRDTPAVRSLIAASARRGLASLSSAQRVMEEISPPYRPVTRFLLDLCHHRLQTIAAAGAAVTRRKFRDEPVACLRLLARARHTG